MRRVRATASSKAIAESTNTSYQDLAPKTVGGVFHNRAMARLRLSAIRTSTCPQPLSLSNRTNYLSRHDPGFQDTASPRPFLDVTKMDSPQVILSPARSGTRTPSPRRRSLRTPPPAPSRKRQVSRVPRITGSSSSNGGGNRKRLASSRGSLLPIACTLDLTPKQKSRSRLTARGLLFPSFHDNSSDQPHSLPMDISDGEDDKEDGREEQKPFAADEARRTPSADDAFLAP